MRPILAIGLIAICTSSVFAHAMRVKCSEKGKQVEVEVFFEEDEPAGNALVKILNRDLQVVYSGTADQGGKWSFARPAPGKYTVQAAHTGHRAEQEIEIGRETASETQPTVTPLTPPREDDNLWLKIAIGLAIIALLSGAFLLASKLRKPAPSSPMGDGGR